MTDTVDSLRQPGLQIWRLQDNRLKTVASEDYGFFHQGASYLVLQITEEITSVHCWIGSDASKGDTANVIERGIDLDKKLHFADIFTVETESYETPTFLRLFPDGLVYLEGDVPSTIEESCCYSKRMYTITGRKYPKATCVNPHVNELTSRSIVLLDGHPRMYLWVGRNCRYVQRLKAIHLAQRIRDEQRIGRAHIVVIDEENEDLCQEFRRKISNDSREILRNGVAEDEESENMIDNQNVVIHRVTGDRVRSDMSEVSRSPLYSSLLVSKDCFLLDARPDHVVYMWIGSQCPDDCYVRAIHRARAYIDYENYPKSTAICRLTENYEPTSFRKFFLIWKNLNRKQKPLSRRYSAANMGRCMFSGSDKRTVAKMIEIWSEDQLIKHDGSTDIWEVNMDGLKKIQEHRKTVFWNNRCYIVQNISCKKKIPQIILYYWFGKRSTSEERRLAQQHAFDMNAKLENSAVLMRILDGREPEHFLCALQHCIVVYDGDIPKSSRNLFQIQEPKTGSTRVTQVPVHTSSLNSCSAYVLVGSKDCFVWYGKDCGGLQREFSKRFMGYLNPKRKYDFDIITQGKETGAFWEELDGESVVSSGNVLNTRERRLPRCVQCHGGAPGYSFSDINEFVQEDLSEEDVFLLDTFDQVFVWCGNSISGEVRSSAPDILKSYITADPAGRDFDQIEIWFLAQHHEPETFTKFFKYWFPDYFINKSTYDLSRKVIRQYNARTCINNEESTNHEQYSKYPYKTLRRSSVPSDVDIRHRERHLVDEEFRSIFSLERVEFYKYPGWKRRQILTSAFLL